MFLTYTTKQVFKTGCFSRSVAPSRRRKTRFRFSRRTTKNW